MHNKKSDNKNLIFLKQGYNFQSDQIKIGKFEIFTTFQKIHCSFFYNIKSMETKSQMKVHLSHVANCYFYNYKPPRIVPQHRVLWNYRKNKAIVITKPDKGNGVFILDWKLYSNATEKIISNTSKFEKLTEDPTLKRKASLQRFYVSSNKTTSLMKFNIRTCILLVLLLLVSMVLLKCKNSPLVIYFLNVIRLFHL